MKIRKRCVAIILVFNVIIVIAQHKKADMNMNELQNKKKEDLVQMAFDLIIKEQPNVTFDPRDFEITAWKNNRGVLVKFRRIIKFFPLKMATDQAIDFDITVNLTNDKILPFDNIISTAFYVPTETDLKSLLFIKEKFGFFSSNFENTIREGENDYFIDCENEFSYGKYILNKKTGELGPALQGSYMPVPFLIDDKDKADFLIEIKE
ncbi:MAG: hypothetical protein EOO44_00420 [Flavobacterium sp.]|nr:MAG: hypothetical protein EOO44_00420 [Flavobacterium sp.]